MAYLNRVTLIGNLGRDPEVRTFPDGGRIATASLATTSAYRDKRSGERIENTEWHNLVFRDAYVESVQKYLKSGISLYVEGELRSRSWEDSGGVKRKVTEIRVTSYQMLGPKKEGSVNQNSSQNQAESNPGNSVNKPVVNNQNHDYDGYQGYNDQEDDDLQF